VGWNVGGQIALGYAFAGIVLLAFAFFARSRTAAVADAEAEKAEGEVPVRADEPAAVAPIDTTRPATA
jgi:AGZA family xanthine/uracil permease-like MFS transporter